MKFQPDSAVQPGVYRHYKGGLYDVLGAATDMESGQMSVVYIPQAGEGAGKLRVRLISEFTDQVSSGEFSYNGPRFVLVVSRNFLGELL
jgi:hypothetical protein